MKRTERVAIEEHTERRILEASMRQAFCPTRVLSPRQLPTDHDYAVSTREYQMINRRRSSSMGYSLCPYRGAIRIGGRPTQVVAFPPFLLTPVSQNAPRRQGLRFAAPKPGAPLTAAVRSATPCCLRRKGGKNGKPTSCVLLLTGHSISGFRAATPRRCAVVSRWLSLRDCCVQ